MSFFFMTNMLPPIMAEHQMANQDIRSFCTDDIPTLIKQSDKYQSLEKFQLWWAFQSACYRHQQSEQGTPSYIASSQKLLLQNGIGSSQTIYDHDKKEIPYVGRNTEKSKLIRMNSLSSSTSRKIDDSISKSEENSHPPRVMHHLSNIVTRRDGNHFNSITQDSTSKNTISPYWSLSSFLSRTGSVQNTFIHLNGDDYLFEKNPSKFLSKIALRSQHGLFSSGQELLSQIKSTDIQGSSMLSSVMPVEHITSPDLIEMNGNSQQYYFPNLNSNNEFFGFAQPSVFPNYTNQLHSSVHLMNDGIHFSTEYSQFTGPQNTTDETNGYQLHNYNDCQGFISTQASCGPFNHENEDVILNPHLDNNQATNIINGSDQQYCAETECYYSGHYQRHVTHPYQIETKTFTKSERDNAPHGNFENASLNYAPVLAAGGHQQVMSQTYLPYEYQQQHSSEQDTTCASTVTSMDSSFSQIGCKERVQAEQQITQISGQNYEKNEISGDKPIAKTYSNSYQMTSPTQPLITPITNSQVNIPATKDFDTHTFSSTHVQKPPEFTQRLVEAKCSSSMINCAQQLESTDKMQNSNGLIRSHTSYQPLTWDNQIQQHVNGEYYQNFPAYVQSNPHDFVIQNNMSEHMQEQHHSSLEPHHDVNTASSQQLDQPHQTAYSVSNFDLNPHLPPQHTAYSGCYSSKVTMQTNSPSLPTSLITANKSLASNQSLNVIDNESEKNQQVTSHSKMMVDSSGQNYEANTTKLTSQSSQQYPNRRFSKKNFRKPYHENEFSRKKNDYGDPASLPYKPEFRRQNQRGQNQYYKSANSFDRGSYYRPNRQNSHAADFNQFSNTLPPQSASLNHQQTPKNFSSQQNMFFFGSNENASGSFESSNPRVNRSLTTGIVNQQIVLSPTSNNRKSKRPGYANGDSQNVQFQNRYQYRSSRHYKTKSFAKNVGPISSQSYLTNTKSF